jgi:uncharacterized membrane protein YdjX (TVP38/TMEM64 family)
MNTFEQFTQYLLYIIPLVLIQLILVIVALVDLPKWLWAVIIILGELIGPIVYLIIGRED